MELRDTERSYVQHLQILRDVFAVPLSKAFLDDVISSHQSSTPAAELLALLTKSEHNSLFQYIDLIRPPHEVFLELLSQRLPRKDSAGVSFENVTVGDLVVAHLKALSSVPHYQQFMTSYPATQAAFAAAASRKPFAEFLIVKKTEAKDKKASSSLSLALLFCFAFSSLLFSSYLFPFSFFLLVESCCSSKSGSSFLGRSSHRTRSTNSQIRSSNR